MTKQKIIKVIKADCYTNEDIKTYKDFVNHCKKNNVKMRTVIIGLINQYLEDNQCTCQFDEALKVIDCKALIHNKKCKARKN